MNAKISVFVISVKSIIYLLLYNLHDRIFKLNEHFYAYILFNFAKEVHATVSSLPYSELCTSPQLNWITNNGLTLCLVLSRA